MAGQALLSYHHPALETIFVVCDIGLPTLLILLVFGVIMFGSEGRKETAFRLLRWFKDKPEPPGLARFLAARPRREDSASNTSDHQG